MVSVNDTIFQQRQDEANSSETLRTHVQTSRQARLVLPRFFFCVPSESAMASVWTLTQNGAVQSGKKGIYIYIYIYIYQLYKGLDYSQKVTKTAPHHVSLGSGQNSQLHCL
jgi:hypothetical protein